MTALLGSPPNKDPLLSIPVWDDGWVYFRLVRGFLALPKHCAIAVGGIALLLSRVFFSILFCRLRLPHVVLPGRREVKVLLVE